MQIMYHYILIEHHQQFLKKLPYKLLIMMYQAYKFYQNYKNYYHLVFLQFYHLKTKH